MEYKTYKEIRLKSLWNTVFIQKMELVVIPNSHAVCKFKIVIPEEDIEKINSDLSEEPVELLIYENAEWKNIFYGYIDEVKFYKENEFNIIEAESTSATKRLDLKKESRSFQDINMTYENIVDEIINKSDISIDAIFSENSTKKINKPIIQYAETDWEFLKRIASHLNTLVIPDLFCDKARFWFGMPEGAEHILTEYELCSTCNNRKLFDRLCEEKCEIIENNNVSYVIKTCDNFEIGDNVKFKNMTLKVYKKHAELAENLWIYVYELVSQNSIFTNRYYNNKINGMSIIGKVIDTSSQCLKVHFDIDEEQEKDKAYWYDYTPQTGNSFYCMPKIGTNVSVYFRDEKEEHARAVSCVRNNGSSCSRMSDYNNRSFTTEHDKVMNLLPDKIDFIAGEDNSPLKITLDENAISFTSDKTLIMGADSNIQFNAKGNISLSAAQSINIFVGALDIQPDSGVITIDMEVNILGVKVHVIGKKEVSLDSVEGPLKRREIDKGKLLRNILIGIGIACVVAAVAAVALPMIAAYTISAGATFAIVAVGGSIPVAIQAGKDIHNGQVSDMGIYARIGFVNALGTALALLPLGSILGKIGIKSKIMQVLFGSGGAGALSAMAVGYLDNGLQGKQYDPSRDLFNIGINAAFNMIPDVSEMVRGAGKQTVEEASKEVSENLAGNGIKSVIRTTSTIDVKAVYAAYGIKYSNANINVLKKAIMKKPEKWVEFVVKDKQMAKQVLKDPTMLDEVLTNTLPIIGANTTTNAETLGEWMYGKYNNYSY